MSTRTTPWLTRTSAYGSWVDNGKYYAQVGCLSEHFDIPDDVPSIRFVQGKCSEALHLSWDAELLEYQVTAHRDSQLDHYITMHDLFDSWFGPRNGWVWVELSYRRAS